ncbi:MAG: hypothetical protein AABW79_04335 [Nanoarchaeota archaeon]
MIKNIEEILRANQIAAAKIRINIAGVERRKREYDFARHSYNSAARWFEDAGDNFNAGFYRGLALDLEDF